VEVHAAEQPAVVVELVEAQVARADAAAAHLEDVQVLVHLVEGEGLKDRALLEGLLLEPAGRRYVEVDAVGHGRCPQGPADAPMTSTGPESVNSRSLVSRFCESACGFT
jgi:hypothetical protein